MKHLLLSAGLTAVTIMIGTAANAQTADTTRERQMEAYRTYVQSQGTAPAEAGQKELAQAPKPVAVVAPANTDGVKTTVEKTTTKTYDVSKRKVGLVGGRAFPTRTETVDGGEVKEVTVNGVEVEKEVVKPDQMEGKEPKGAEGDYYTGRRGIRAYKDEEKKPNSNLDVHFTGKFNN